ncbi:phosphorylase [Methylobacterium sp.]|uniref:phosphorylase n=1 Tax=Methylobacterium sp. TaxID=409 RepID=UPI0025DE5719|nr:phosphorylase [Methylobacterium sp.]
MRAYPGSFVTREQDEGALVLAVVGLSKEERLASGQGIAVAGAGGNPLRLRTMLDGRAPAGLRAVVSFGIAGGLDPGLKPGDVIVASGIAARSCRYDTDPAVTARLRETLGRSGFRAAHAELAGVDEAVLSVAGKAALRNSTGAAAVDMESHVAAAFALRHGLPFAAVRAVCDPADRALPAFVATALKPNGDPDILAVLAAVIGRRASIGDLVRLARDSSAAFGTLTRCRRSLGHHLGLLSAESA